MTEQTQTPKRGLSRREWTWLAIGIVVAIGIIVAVAMLTGGNDTQTGVVQINRPAPEISLQTLDGTTAKLSDYRGKIVLVNFWATWCEPCKKETPDLVQAAAEYGDKLVILGINVTNIDKNLDEVRRFAQRYNVQYPILLDQNGAVQRDFAMYALPVSYFIDSDGVIRYTRTTAITKAEIDRVMQDLLTP
ncbi:MAG: TlpA family protein disulfide reductase [Herpetosiphon sp.]|nr:TlpA family protein disulfide reductase [Herpetosiphon sp.]